MYSCEVRKMTQYMNIIINNLIKISKILIMYIIILYINFYTKLYKIDNSKNLNKMKNEKPIKTTKNNILIQNGIKKTLNEKNKINTH